MSKVWTWIVTHVEIVLGGIVAVLVGWIAWGTYDRKVNKLKDSVKVQQALGQVARLETKRDEALKDERVLAKKDEALDAKIIEAQKKAVEVRENVKGRSPNEIARRFNELYR